jgi:hypothetical protein
MAMVLLLGISCKKETPEPPNPYDDIVYPTDSVPTDTVNPNSITGIHRNILQVKCNNPGCHDGTFEPDFRTVQSAWSTLLYHPVVKNDAGNTYTYRVVPYDLGASMLYRRLTVDDPQLQQMPATGQYLTPAEQAQVEAWIMGGAPDPNGHIATLPNEEPVIVGYLALNANDQRIDTTENRVDSVYYNPFYVDHGVTLKIVVLVTDDSTAAGQLQVNTLKFSTQKDNFVGATSLPTFFLNIPGYQVWILQFNTNILTPNTTYFMRYYVNDGDHPQPTEFPRNETEDGYKTYWALHVKP